MATIKTSLPGNKQRGRSEGYVLLSMIIGLLIAGMSFGTVAGSIALLVRNAATIKSDLLHGIEQRSAAAVDMKTVFGAEE